jgi:hypothetical protein
VLTSRRLSDDLDLAHAVPVQAVGDELERIVKASEHWDGKVCGLVVTDATDRAPQLCALVSAQDGGKAWDLRCEVREKLVDFLQKNYPNALPRVRGEFGLPHPRQAAGTGGSGSR